MILIHVIEGFNALHAKIMRSNYCRVIELQRFANRADDVYHVAVTSEGILIDCNIHSHKTE